MTRIDSSPRIIPVTTCSSESSTALVQIAELSAYSAEGLIGPSFAQVGGPLSRPCTSGAHEQRESAQPARGLGFRHARAEPASGALLGQAASGTASGLF